jgi:hypothetical protein
MILSFNKCIKNALENGFYDAVMKSNFINNMYTFYQNTDDTIYASVILHKKCNNNNKNICTLYNRVKIYYENDFIDEHKFTRVADTENNEIVFTNNGIKVYFNACYIYKSEEDFDLTMTYHKENAFIKNYLKKNGLSIIVYKLSFENTHSCNDDELIHLFEEDNNKNKTKLSKKSNKRKKIERTIPKREVPKREILTIENQQIEKEEINNVKNENQMTTRVSKKIELTKGCL